MEVRGDMGIGWASCPVCGRVFEGSYFPDTNMNTAEDLVQRHAILRHGKKITDDGRIVDAQIPDDFIKASEMKPFVAGVTGNVHLQRRAYITCVCGRFFTIDFEEVCNDGKNIRVEVREYDDDTRTRKISEKTEVIRVGHVDVDKFRRLWEQTWESVKERIIYNHLLEHGIEKGGGDEE